MAQPNLPTEDIEDHEEGSEYEYDEHETEDFYITLDLSSALPLHRAPKRSRSTTKPAEPSPPAHGPTTTDPSPTPSAPPQDSIQPDLPTSKPPPQALTTSKPNTLQILDLHTKNPILTHQNQLYTCTWGSALGTDILLAPTYPEATVHASSSDLQPHASILATTSIRLSGRPVEAVPRRKANPAHSNPTPSSAQSYLASTASATEGKKETATTVDPGPNASKARQNQANFLSRLMDIKRAKGETDKVITQLPAPNRKYDEQGNAIPGRGGDKGGRKGRGRGRGKGRPRGRGRGRGRGARGGMASFAVAGTSGVGGSGSGGGATPERWPELESSGGDVETRAAEGRDGSRRGHEGGGQDDDFVMVDAP